MQLHMVAAAMVAALVMARAQWRRAADTSSLPPRHGKHDAKALPGLDEFG
jgi:hypothetical protein